jgi:hypothetical protein
VPERDREDLFDAAVKAREKKEAEAARSEKKRRLTAFRTLLDGANIKVCGDSR